MKRDGRNPKLEEKLQTLEEQKRERMSRTDRDADLDIPPSAAPDRATVGLNALDIAVITVKPRLLLLFPESWYPSFPIYLGKRLTQADRGALVRSNMLARSHLTKRTGQGPTPRLERHLTHGQVLRSQIGPKIL